MAARKKFKKIDPDSKEYDELERQCALSYAPEIYPCADCGHPVASRYCCNHCGSSHPQRESTEEELNPEAKKHCKYCEDTHKCPGVK